MLKTVLLLVLNLVLIVTVFAQTYGGSVGMVVPYPALIVVDPAGRSAVKKFSGVFQVVPGVLVPIAGTVRPGWFSVDGWFTVRATWGGSQIVGDGVRLYRP